MAALKVRFCFADLMVSPRYAYGGSATAGIWSCSLCQLESFPARKGLQK